MRSESRKDERGGFLLTFEPGRSERIDAYLRYRNHEATEAFSSVDWQLHLKEIVFVSFSLGHEFAGRDRTIDGAVLMERMSGHGATGKLKMRLHSPVMFDNPIELKELPNTFHWERLLSSSINLQRIDPNTWRKLLTEIKRVRPAHAADLDALVKKQFDDRRIFPVNERTVRLMEQRDAIGTAIGIAGLDRARVLQSLDPSKISTADSALELLDSEPLQERDALRIDQGAFGALLRQGMKHAEFKGERGGEVRVHIYDGKPLETVLGIDLLIYLALYRAYVLVQYKMMKKAKRRDGGWYYPVDEHLRGQLAAMNRAAAVMKPNGTVPLPLGDWRLAEEVFFWKFCEATRISDAEGSLVHGMTLSRPHLASFLELADSEVESGARRVGYANCPRYLTPTQFVDLAQAGWIGGGANARTVIEKLLEANQLGGRQTILAAVSQAEDLKTLRRGWR